VKHMKIVVKHMEIVVKHWRSFLGENFCPLPVTESMLHMFRGIFQELLQILLCDLDEQNVASMTCFLPDSRN
jgi:hypothetical protein